MRQFYAWLKQGIQGFLLWTGFWVWEYRVEILGAPEQVGETFIYNARLHREEEVEPGYCGISFKIKMKEAWIDSSEEPVVQLKVLDYAKLKFRWKHEQT